MAKLYYGNKNVTIEGTNIRAVLLKFRGAITIEDKTPEGFAITERNNGILIFPIGGGTLNELFDYEGELKIVSVKVADINGESVPTTIHKVMDYSELLGVSESITTNSEDLKSGHISGNRPSKTSLNQPIIPNLHTSNWKVELYDRDGNLFSGDFHVHLKDSSAMTGKEHTEDSQDLYFKKEGKDKLVPTKNPSSVPQALKKSRAKVMRAFKRDGKTGNGVGGAGY